MTKMQNPFVWHDLMTPDVAAARKFYGAVVGWNFTDSGAPNEPYTIINAGMIGIGGIMGFRPEDDKSIPPFWTGYIFVPDVDATIKDIEKRGGKLFKGPIDVPGMVRFAIMLDPHGAMFNILTPLSEGPQDKAPPGTAGHVGWNELHAGDLNEAWDFYSGLFGWTKGMAMDMKAMGIYQVFQIDGQDAGGMMKRQPMLPSNMWLHYFNVNGIDAAVTRITEAGGKIAMGPHQVPGGQWIVSAFDPQGGSFQLLSATK